MADPVASLDLLTRLRMKGFRLSIDDFGTGYSSMMQLARLPFSEIKVDKSFVMTLPASDESRAVVRSIIELGHSLGMVATAEGVESEAILDFLNSAGCDLAQGYHIARPMTERGVERWLQQRRPQPAQ
jgi:EAL domain-containing protein (putative c-di-GMP-specific phosphodiesterase class I)